MRSTRECSDEREALGEMYGPTGSKGCALERPSLSSDALDLRLTFAGYYAATTSPSSQ